MVHRTCPRARASVGKDFCVLFNYLLDQLSLVGNADDGLVLLELLEVLSLVLVLGFHLHGGEDGLLQEVLDDWVNHAKARLACDLHRTSSVRVSAFFTNKVNYSRFII